MVVVDAGGLVAEVGSMLPSKHSVFAFSTEVKLAGVGKDVGLLGQYSLKAITAKRCPFWGLAFVFLGSPFLALLFPPGATSGAICT